MLKPKHNVYGQFLQDPPLRATQKRSRLNLTMVEYKKSSSINETSEETR